MLAAQVSGEKEFFANLVVDAVLRLDLQTLDLRMIGMKKARTALQTCQCYLAAYRICRDEWNDPSTPRNVRGFSKSSKMCC